MNPLHKNSCMVLPAWFLAAVLGMCALASWSAEDKIAEDQARLNEIRWRYLSEAERQAVRETAWAMDPGRFSTLKEKMELFRSLPMEDQVRIRESYKRFQALSPEERESLEKKHTRFKNLPEYQQSALRNYLRQQPASPEPEAGDRSGSHGRRGGRPTLEELLRRYDANGDGKLTGQERKAVGAGKRAVHEADREAP